MILHLRDKVDTRWVVPDVSSEHGNCELTDLAQMVFGYDIGCCFRVYGVCRVYMYLSSAFLEKTAEYL